MMNMNGLLNGAKPQVPNGTTQNPNQKTQVALPRCNDVNVIGKTGEGNKPYICKGKYLPKTNPKSESATSWKISGSGYFNGGPNTFSGHWDTNGKFQWFQEHISVKTIETPVGQYWNH